MGVSHATHPSVFHKLCFNTFPTKQTHLPTALQPVLDVLTQPLTDLGAVHAVKEAACEAPELVIELWRHGQQLRMARDVMDAFKHAVRGGCLPCTELFSPCRKAVTCTCAESSMHMGPCTTICAHEAPC